MIDTRDTIMRTAALTWIPLLLLCCLFTRNSSKSAFASAVAVTAPVDIAVATSPSGYNTSGRCCQDDAGDEGWMYVLRHHDCGDGREGEPNGYNDDYTSLKRWMILMMMTVVVRGNGDNDVADDGDGDGTDGEDDGGDGAGDGGVVDER